jgi:hypothetical protein
LILFSLGDIYRYFGEAYCLRLQVHTDGGCNPIRNIIIFLPEYTVSHINSIYTLKRYMVLIYAVTQKIHYNIPLNRATYLQQLYGLPQATRLNM